MNRLKRRVRLYRIKLAAVFERVESFADFWLAISTIFNFLNLKLKKTTGVFLPFSLGIPTDELRDPVGVNTLKVIETRFRPVPLQMVDAPVHLNFMIPTISPDLIFGGYIGLFNFMNSLLKEGYKLRILVCEDVLPSVEDVERKLGEGSVVTKVIKASELRECLDRKVVQTIGKGDVFVGYSWMTMRLAAHAAQTTNKKLPIFFIQEFEPIFHHYDSLRFFAEETYTFPHAAVFNSPQLKNFFSQKSLGVFRKDNPEYCVFKHAIAEIPKPNVDDLQARTKKRLLVYARPERHAGRNLFEVSILALKEAIRQGILDKDDWEFFGIGSLGKSTHLELLNGIQLKLIPRLSFKEYTESLPGYDVGMSLMYAPHPSVPPLEMASAGMLAITTCFENRSPEEMSAMSPNIIAASHTMESLVSSIREAVKRCDDFSARRAGAEIQWSTSWGESFGREFMDQFNDLVPVREES